MLNMKSILFLVGVFAIFSACGQQDKSKRPSPPDSVKATLKSGATVSINYSQPAVKGRTIGNDLEPLPGKVWRTGANEATVFESDKNIKVGGKDLPAGKYGLFTIANGNDWTIIFNKETDTWGAFKYDMKKDLVRMDLPIQKQNDITEEFAMVFEKATTGANLIIAWDNVRVSLPIVF